MEKLNTHNKGGSSDMVLGPAKDGGYYLVALNKDALKHLGK